MIPLKVEYEGEKGRRGKGVKNICENMWNQQKIISEYYLMIKISETALSPA